MFLGGGDGFLYAFDPDPVPNKDDPDFPFLAEYWRIDCNPEKYRFKVVVQRPGEPAKTTPKRVPIKYFRRD